MKKMKIIKKYIEEEEIAEICCNYCEKQFTKDEIDFGNYIEIKKSFGYDIQRDVEPRDGDAYEFHLCYKCFDKVIDLLKIKPEITRYF